MTLLTKIWEQHLDEEKILNIVTAEKDVDGFNPLNMGNLAMRGREPLFIPCTPKGCIEILIRSGVEIMGKKAVVIGRSNIAGLPTSLLLQVTVLFIYSFNICTSTFLYLIFPNFVSFWQRHHATVTILHELSKNPDEITREADILVSAAGVPNLVRGHWLKPGAVVIDVGTFPIEVNTRAIFVYSF